MARRPLIAANWKMNKTVSESVAFARALITPLALGRAVNCDLLLIPPFLSVGPVAEIARGHHVLMGAQNLFWEESGAYTGEVSAAMIADAGASHVLVGHSERRNVMSEDNAAVARKLRAAVDGGLIAVLCVGEKLEEREAGSQERVVEQQLSTAFDGWTAADVSSVVVAYEPVWAIGTGRTATPDDADAMHGFIRSWARSNFSDAVAEGMRILYGGSVKPGNAGSLLGCEHIDGALVGGASLEVDSFLGIAEATPDPRG